MTTHNSFSNKCTKLFLLHLYQMLHIPIFVLFILCLHNYYKNIFLHISSRLYPIAELTRGLCDQASFVKASSGVIYSWIHSGWIRPVTCLQRVRVALSHWVLLKSLQNPYRTFNRTPTEPLKSAVKPHRGLWFQKSRLRLIYVADAIFTVSVE